MGCLAGWSGGRVVIRKKGINNDVRLSCLGIVRNVLCGKFGLCRIDGMC